MTEKCHVLQNQTERFFKTVGTRTVAGGDLFRCERMSARWDLGPKTSGLPTDRPTQKVD